MPVRRSTNLWHWVYAWDNLLKAASKACSSRKDKQEVAEFVARKDENLRALQKQLRDRTYVCSEYYLFEKEENGKKRLISDLPLYPDRIAHWAVALVIEPLIDKRLIPQTHASRKNHGSHSAVDNVRKYIDNDTRIRYALKLDVKQFFPSIDKGIMKQVLRRVIKDKEMLWFLDHLIDDYPLPGIALGNRLSPMMANLLLSHAIDYRLKQVNHVHYIVRYMDDVIILGYSKKWLHQIRDTIEGYLAEYGLTLKGNWQVFPIDKRGIDFVGYVIYRDRTLLRTATKKRLKRKCKNMAPLLDSAFQLSRSVQGTIWSYDGILKHCDSRGLREATIAPFIRKIEMEKRLIQGFAEWRRFMAYYSKECDLF